MGVVRGDELDEEGDEEEDGLGVHQADDEGGAEGLAGVAFAQAAGGRLDAAPALHRGPQQADAEPHQVGAAGVLEHHEQGRHRHQQGGDAGGGQDHQDQVAEEDAAGAPVAGGDAPAGGHQGDVHGIGPGQQYDEDGAEDEGGQVGDAVGHAGAFALTCSSWGLRRGT